MCQTVTQRVDKEMYKTYYVCHVSSNLLNLEIILYVGLETLAVTLDFSKGLAYDFGSKFEISPLFANCQNGARNGLP